MKILVTGASGYIGGRLVTRLLAEGHQVRCMARDPSRLEGRPWPGVEIVAGDALVAESLGPAVAGVDVAYYLIHSLAAGEGRFEDMDQVAARQFGEAASRAGVRQVIYLGGLGETHAALSKHLRSRQETGEALRATGVAVTEFRAAVIVGSGSLSFEMIRYLTERVPVMITPRWVNTRCQPIAVRDVIAYLVAALGHPGSLGRIFEIGGPEVLTYGGMMLGYARVRGLWRWLVPVPVLTPRLSSYWVDLVTPIPKAYARTLVTGMSNEVIVHDDAAARLFGVPATPYDEAVRLALARIERGEVETSWADSFPSSPRQPGVSLEEREGRVFERRTVAVEAGAAAVYKVFSGIGGRRGWFHANFLWHLRGLLDRLVGGVGMRRGRRDPDDLRPGDALDFWRVESVEPGRSLRLRAEMKVPGRAWLVFEVRDEGAGRSRMVQTAVFEPRGLFGVLYWYSLYPIHQVIFSGMADAIRRRAEAAR
ncbi:MAG: SDR family oxidoreductase [Candidatus Eisenbacteria bacterium]|uniref:SDR family oxidoreductase n=1 Tax=Eiseniibacteriota bacterium TaxID=2212470 RepID=A0A933SBH6_UNCEI|nr:SDR family oxidoreductase [Candidatus Eisenbacteria bacterium]